MNYLTQLDAVHHVAVQVSDLQQAVHWYQTSFRCELLHQDKQQAILQFANVVLALVLPGFQQPHLAFIRDDAATLGELREQADSTRSTFISDAGGNLVEIIAADSLQAT